MSRIVIVPLIYHSLKPIESINLLVSWGNKYRNMTLQVGGVSKIESIKYAQLKTTDPTSRQRKHPTSLSQKPSRNN
jgi:hypothetical protein